MQFRIWPHYLKVLEFNFTTSQTTDYDKPIIGFTFAIGRDNKTHEKRSINFRWEVTITEGLTQVLRYVAEQQFDFVDPISQLKEHNIKFVINETALQCEIEYEKQSIMQDEKLKKLFIVRPDVSSIILREFQS